jgi:polysaccharide biosynthesis/export protein
MKKTIIKILLFFILLQLFSCVSYKNLVLLNENKQAYSPNNSSDSTTYYKIQQHDVLKINVSSTDQASVAIFNKEVGATSGSSQVGEGNLYFSSYVVNDSGKISIPILGDISAKGQNVYQLRDSIQKKINTYYKFAIVDVKLASFRISCLGELRNQGAITIYRDKINLMEALALAGGFTDLAKRNSVKIIRTIDGKTEIKRVDFTSEGLLNHEWYQLMPNDVIYVEPLKAAALKTNTTTVSLVISVVSFALLLLNFTTRSN